MYSVSQAYLDKLTSVSVKRRRIRGTLDGVAFTENDILTNAFSYTDTAVKSADIKLGGVFVGSLSLTFLQAFVDHISRGTWRGKTLLVTVDLLTGYNNNEPVWESVPLKPYFIDEANHSALGVDVVAYDAMSRFDAAVQMSTTTGDLYGFLTLACNAADVTLGMTQEQVEALPNGDQILSLYPDNDVETWRDLVSWCAATAGGFATINRSGNLEIRTWHTTPDLTIGVNDRFSGGSWSDFVTNYTAVKIKYIDSDTEGYYATAQDTGLTLDLGANPLLQYGIDETKEARARAILTAVQNLRYTPFKSRSLIDPALDLGDVITYADGIADDALCCVMRIDFSFSKGATVQGYGKNPSLNGARSKADKAIAAAAGKNKSNELTYYTFTNAEAKTVTTAETSLYSLTFTAAKKTTVELWHEIKCLSDFAGAGNQSMTLYYYLDNVLLDYEPVETWAAEGYHTPHRGYWFKDVEGMHDFEVRAKVSAGTAAIGIDNIHAMIKGQNMVASESTPSFNLTDELTPYLLGRLIASLSESAVSIATQVPQAITLNDTVYVYSLGRLIKPINDTSMSLTARAVQYTRVTEDEDYIRVTEDGGTRLTEG